MSPSRQKPLNPYQRLYAACREWAGKVIAPHQRRTMALNRGDVERGANWDLRDLLQRAVAAEQLGYTTEIRLTDTQVEFWLVKKRPDSMPWELR